MGATHVQMRDPTLALPPIVVKIEVATPAVYYFADKRDKGRICRLRRLRLPESNGYNASHKWIGGARSAL